MFVPFATIVFAQLYESFAAVKQLKLDTILRWFVVVFGLCALGLLVLPFLKAGTAAIALGAAVVLGVFCWTYWRTSAGLRVWAFIAGIILLRLVYAILFIPLQDEGTAHYEAPVQKATLLLKKEQLYYWAPSQSFAVAVDTKLFSWKKDTIQVPPLIHPQVPYYYYKHSGKLLQYDTTVRSGVNYVSFDKDLKGMVVDSVYSFTDKRGVERMVFYKKG